nr:terpene synthase family protein [Lentzea jiangxiensis]
MSDWTCWAFVTDDQYTDGGPIMDKPHEWNPLFCKLLYSMANPETREYVRIPPLGAAFRDLSERLERTTSPARFLEWVSAHYIWLLGSACSVSDRSVKRIRSLDEHLIVGPLDRAEPLSTLMIQIAEDTELPPQLQRLPKVRAITDVAHVLHSFYNDLASYSHELHQECPQSNFVHVLKIEQAISPQDAIVEAVRFLDRLMLLFVALRDELNKSAGTELRRYLRQLSNKIRGNSDFQRIAARYTTVLDVKEGITSISENPTDAMYEYSDHPSDNQLSAPFSSISWWWDQLGR